MCNASPVPHIWLIKTKQNKKQKTKKTQPTKQATH